MSRTDIVVVNWNAGPLLEACVRSVLTNDENARVVDRLVVVDNNSTDQSMTALAPLGSRVTVINNEINRGFAAACNQGAAGSRADYLLFLNPDTQLQGNSLSVPIAYLDASVPEQVAIAGIRMVDLDGNTVPSSRRFPTLRTVLGDITRLSSVWPSLFPPSLLPLPDDADPVEVDQLIGAFFLIRRSVFLELGGFDERFFVYYEEVDLSYRAHLRGYRSIYLPGASALHHGGYSSNQVRAKRLFYSLRSRLLFSRKHWSRLESIALGLMTYGLELPARLLISTLRASPVDVLATLQGYANLTAWILSAGRRPLP